MENIPRNQRVKNGIVPAVPVSISTPGPYGHSQVLLPQDIRFLTNGGESLSYEDAIPVGLPNDATMKVSKQANLQLTRPTWIIAITMLITTIICLLASSLCSRSAGQDRPCRHSRCAEWSRSGSGSNSAMSEIEKTKKKTGEDFWFGEDSNPFWWTYCFFPMDGEMASPTNFLIELWGWNLGSVSNLRKEGWWVDMPRQNSFWAKPGPSKPNTPEKCHWVFHCILKLLLISVENFGAVSHQ